MADEQKKKQYGLIFKGKKDEKPVIKKVASVFDNDDDDDDKVDVSYSTTSASTIRMQKAAERQHERALAEDPSVFDYDASYDEIQAVKNEKLTEQHEKDANRESKYAELFIKAKLRRDIEKHSREDRQQQQERIREGEEFADKEVFVTGAYRKRMEEIQNFREEEAYEARFNDLTSVDHQKDWRFGIGRMLLNDVARSGVLKKDEETSEEPATFSDLKKKGVKNIRKRQESRSSSPEAEAEPEQKPKDEVKKKSIYDDDDDAPVFKPPPIKPKQKNFEGELKPGLNTVSKKAQTQAEKLKERQFTPTPPSSDDESDRKRDRNAGEGKKEIKEEDIKKETLEEKKAKKKIVRLNPEEIKAKRLIRLKELVKQRNGPEEINAFRERYLQRRDMNFVEPPLC